MKLFRSLSLLFALLPFSLLKAQEVKDLNLQFHWDFQRDFLTVTQEFYGTDKLGFTFFFMDLNFDHYRGGEFRKQDGVTDFYFEFMRYFKIASVKRWDLNFTIQYDDGTAPIARWWLAGLNLSNIVLGPFNLSTEFLLKQEYKLKVNWQYTLVWYAEFFGGKLIFNGFLDYWMNDIDNPTWPKFDPEFARTKYSLQTEPQIGWRFSPHWKIGSEVEISRGFLGSVSGRLMQEENYRYDKWYVLPTVFLQYNF